MAKGPKNDSQAVDGYLATPTKAERESLQRLRMLIKETIPQVEERVSYGTTVMFSLRRDLAGFVSQPKHLSFFTGSPELALAMQDEITKTHKLSGATIHFSIGHPLSARACEEDSSSTGPRECRSEQRWFFVIHPGADAAGRAAPRNPSRPANRRVAQPLVAAATPGVRPGVAAELISRWAVRRTGAGNWRLE